MLITSAMVRTKAVNSASDRIKPSETIAKAICSSIADTRTIFILIPLITIPLVIQYSFDLRFYYD